MKPKQYTETKKVSKVEKEKKCETSGQRAKRFSPFNPLKTLTVGTLLFSPTGMVKATRPESNKVTEVADLSTYNNRAVEYVPSRQQMEEAKTWYRERGLPFNPPPDDAQGTSGGETSQPAEKLSQGIHLKKKVKIPGLSREIHSRKETPSGESMMETPQGEQDKKHLKSNEEKIATVQAWMEKVKENPELLQRFKKTLAERRLLSEQEARQARKLDTPDNQCLDIGLTQAFSDGPVSTTNPPGQALEFTIQGVAYNGCDSTVSNVKYIMQALGNCPSGADGPQITTTIIVNDANPIKNGTSGAPPDSNWQALCEASVNGQVVSALAPTSLELSGFATAVDANGKAVQSPNINIKVL